MDNLLVSTNVIIIILNILIVIYSIKLVKCLKQGYDTGWWWALPLVSIWTLVDNTIEFLYMHNIVDSNYFHSFYLLQLPTYIFMLIFVMGLNSAVKKLICDKDGK